MTGVARRALSGMIVTSMLMLAMASSASAVQWSPQGVAEGASGVTGSNWIFTDSVGHHITCTTFSTTVVAAGAVFTTVGSPPMIFSGCTNDIIGGSTVVTAAGSFTYTATSTSNVTFNMKNVGGNVLTISLAGGICTITVPSGAGGVTIPNNSWSNTTHRLNLNTSSAFVINQSAGCFTVVGASATLAAAYQFPSAVTVV
jgi:hypothetical protein